MFCVDQVLTGFVLLTGTVSMVVGADSMECVVDQVLESLQYTKLNKSVCVCVCMICEWVWMYLWCVCGVYVG